MKLENLLQSNCYCCACGKKCEEMPAFADMPFRAHWFYPVWGNFETGIIGNAVSLVCTECETKKVKTSTIQYAIEFIEDKCLYHKIKWMQLDEEKAVGTIKYPIMPIDKPEIIP